MREVLHEGFFWKWGQLMYRYRYMVLAIWFFIFVSFAIVAPQAPGLLKDNGFTPKGSEAEVGQTALLNELDLPESVVTIVYEGEGLDLTSEEQKQKILASLQPFQNAAFVENISFEYKTRNPGNLDVQAVNVSLNLNYDDALQRFPEIQKLVVAPEGMNAYLSGGTAVLYDLQQASKKDIVKAEMIGLPIALLILLLVFGTVIGAMLPLVIGLVSMTTTLGIIYFIAPHASLSNFLPSMVSMLGLAVGIDYALFLVSRFREEFQKRGQVAEAIAVTSQTTGKSIFFSGIAVLISLLGMLFVELTFFQSLCLGGILVVSISVVAANTLLLSLLGVLGHRINSWRVIPKRFTTKNTSKFWEKVAYMVMKRPVWLVLIVGGILLWAMLPVNKMQLDVPGAEVLPPSYDSRYGSDLIDKVYDSREMDPILIRIHAPESAWQESTIRDVRQYTAMLQSTAGVKEVKSYLSGLVALSDVQVAQWATIPENRQQIEQFRIVKDQTAMLTVLTEADPDDITVNQLVKELRNLDAPTNLEVQVTGGPAYRIDIIDRIQGEVWNVIIFVMGITYVVLLFAFRSVLLPLKAVFMNALSLGASLGIVVLVFQFGYFADVLSITSIGYVSATIPVIIFCVVFGISMDYEVFLISRIAEEYDATGNNELSTAIGLQKTGGLITSAAAILIAVVGSFVFTDIEIMKALGLGLGLAVFIDATIIRVMLVPALMKLLGKANWWAPKWVRNSKSNSSQSM
jgi:RND superfamily putative drug exporter